MTTATLEKKINAELRRQAAEKRNEHRAQVRTKIQGDLERAHNAKVSARRQKAAALAEAEMLAGGPVVTITAPDGKQVIVRLAHGDSTVRLAGLTAIRMIAWSLMNQYHAQVVGAREAARAERPFTPKPMDLGLALDDPGARKVTKLGLLSLSAGAAPARRAVVPVVDDFFSGERFQVSGPTPDEWLND